MFPCGFRQCRDKGAAAATHSSFSFAPRPGSELAEIAPSAYCFGLQGALAVCVFGWQNLLMTATLTLDNLGRLLLPAQILRVLGTQPGVEMKVEVTPGRIELLNGQEANVPVITELSADGTLLLPPGVTPPSAEKIVEAIKSDREDRIAKLSRR